MTHSYNICRRPEALSIGYGVAVFNLIGSVFFLIASVGYFIRVRTRAQSQQWVEAVHARGVDPCPEPDLSARFTGPASRCAAAVGVLRVRVVRSLRLWCGVTRVHAGVDAGAQGGARGLMLWYDKEFVCTCGRAVRGQRSGGGGQIGDHRAAQWCYVFTNCFVAR